LVQLILYGIWSVAGEGGVVVLRVASYCGILLFFLWWLRQKGFGLAEVVFIFLAGNILRHYSAERPQLFAFILLPLLLFFLESLRRSEPDISWPKALCIPLIVFCWSNLHGSFVLALLIVAVYVVDSMVASFRNKRPVDKGVMALLVGTILSSLVNPGGWTAFAFSFNFLKMQASRTSEFTSPFTMAIQYHVIDYYFWTLVLVVIIMLIVHWRKVEPIHAVVVLGLLLLSFKGTRYVPFFALAAPLTCFSVPVWRPSPKVGVALISLIAVWVATEDYRNVFKFRVEKSFPVAATKFLAETRPVGNLFNYVTWGGYILCYSDYPVFVDTRNLVEKYVAQHDRVLAGISWQEILDSHNIQTIIIPGTSAISCEAYPLLLKLLTAPQWVLVYQDDVALVLVRQSEANLSLIEKYAISKDEMTNHIQARWKWQLSGEY
jgi:hypothetical protein